MGFDGYEWAIGLLTTANARKEAPAGCREPEDFVVTMNGVNQTKAALD